MIIVGLSLVIPQFIEVIILYIISVLAVVVALPFAIICELGPLVNELSFFCGLLLVVVEYILTNQYSNSVPVQRNSTASFDRN